jgi:S1-C subfamily serine protease
LDDLTSLGVEWKTHAQQDLAATLFPANSTFDLTRFPSELLEDFQNIREGDDIFFLGFPLTLGVTTTARVTPIVRTGTVALKNEDQTFLIDASVFPGNSGSPVFFKPCPIQFGSQGLEIGRVRPAKLIGIVTSSVTYTDTAVSVQTGNPRITFEENSGLGSVLSVRFINDIVTSSSFQTMITAALEREARARTPQTTGTQ